MNHVPVSGRTADELARVIGYQDMSALSESIPNNGVIMDVGSGKSNFLSVLSSLRPDITAINFDFAYKNNDLDLTSNLSPENLHYIAGDMRQMPFKEESFDWVVSYWALSYLVQEKRIIVLNRLYDLVKPSGRLSVGPVYDLNSGFIIPEVAKTITKEPGKSYTEWISDTTSRIRDHSENLFVPPLMSS